MDRTEQTSKGRRVLAPRAAPHGYSKPDFRAPLSTGPMLAAIPAQAWVKGFYARAIVRDLEDNGFPMPDVKLRSDFSNYPTREAADLLLTAANRLYGAEPPREGLRRVGWTIFPALLQMMIGQVLFGALGRDVQAIALAAPKGFEVSMSTARCTVVERAATHIELNVSDYPLFADCFLVGVLEGALAYCGHGHCELLIRRISPHSVDYFVALSS